MKGRCHIESKKVCCFTGHRHSALDKDSSALTGLVERAAAQGYTHFISGMALGFDIEAAVAVLAVKGRMPEIFLECALPCEDQALNWNKKDIDIYLDVLNKADKITLVNKEYDKFCMMKRNRYMVELSSLVIARYDGRRTGGTHYTVMHAKKLNREIWLV